MKYLLLAIWTLFLLRPVQAEIVEMQEVRLAKAQLAQAQGHDKEALALVAQNLDPAHFHRASYQFLVDYHLKRGNIAKAFKVLYYMVGKLHDRRVLNARFDKHFESFLASIGKPSRDALELYFAIGELYYNLYQKRVFPPKFRPRLLSLAEKYFHITSFYRYDLALTKVYIGKIHSERAHFQDALEEFMEAKELFRDQYNIDGEDGFEDLNFLIGSTLIQGGLLDPGSIYLRSVYSNADTSSSLKGIAQEYLNILAYDFFSFTARYEIGHDSNVYELNDVQLSNYSIAEEVLGPQDGQFSRISASMLYNHPRLTQNIGAFLQASFSQQSYSDELHKNNNERTITAGGEFKYEGLEKAVPKLRYYMTLNYIPNGNEDEFQKNSTTHYLEAIYVRPIKSGTLSYSIPFLKTNYDSGASEQSLGISVSYTPFWINRYFSPSIGLGFFTREEANIEDKSTRIELSGGAQSEWSDRFSTFTNLVIRKNTNAIESLDYLEYEAALNGTWSWRYGLSFGLDATWRQRSSSNDREINVWTVSSGISFTY